MHVRAPTELRGCASCVHRQSRRHETRQGHFPCAPNRCPSGLRGESRKWEVVGHGLIATRHLPAILHCASMAQPPKSVLWIDDEADLLESHRIFLREQGFEVDAATNADDAVEMLRRRPYGLVLLDEQMPGKRGLEAFREIRELDAHLPIVMVTKSEEDATLHEAIGVDIRDYLVKPINPRQVLTVITRILEGPKIRQQAIARSFVERFRAFELERERTLGWREWVARYSEVVDWDIQLTRAGEESLYEALQALYPDLRREFADFMRRAYPAWLRDL